MFFFFSFAFVIFFSFSFTQCFFQSWCLHDTCMQVFTSHFATRTYRTCSRWLCLWVAAIYNFQFSSTFLRERRRTRVLLQKEGPHMHTLTNTHTNLGFNTRPLCVQTDVDTVELWLTDAKWRNRATWHWGKTAKWQMTIGRCIASHQGKADR